MTSRELKLNGYAFQALFTPEGLLRLDDHFMGELAHSDPDLHVGLLAYRDSTLKDPKLISQLLIDCAPKVEAFVAELFSLQVEVQLLQARVQQSDPIFQFKKHFVLREAKRSLKKSDTFPAFADLDAWLSAQIPVSDDRELAVAEYANKLLADADQTKDAQAKLVAWCVRAMTSAEGRLATCDWVSFHLPARLDYANLINIEPVDDALERLQAPSEHWRARDGFTLTDHRMSEREVQDEVHYCVYCHKNDGDFCSKGFPVKKGNPDQGLKLNPLNELLTGCPLEEKISEMQFLKKQGYSIAPLAVVMIDNPMCPATGHRICNDCMKACIYQKQEPVNIPEIESRVLTDVLGLPFGVEVYDLLTRWNPLRPQQFVAKPYNAKKVLVMGMGPAGFTLAHHLLMEGFAVVGADGLKLEPLPDDFIHSPIASFDEIKESLDDRVMTGFGGVAEYGITVRWDKNFLKLIYISLLRRPYFQVYGSVRFGGTLTVDDAWRLGFDHLAIAVGAGLPRELRIPNSLAPGMRQANDFLMALQLTGAAKFSSLANLQVRLPAVIIGGGLTGIDTATEVQAYYITQVEKTAYRYQLLKAYYGELSLRARFDKASLDILDEFLQHASELVKERALAESERRAPDLIRLLREWGGVTVVYRRTLQESPAYRRNHEEVGKALEEGIYYAEGLEPEAVRLDSSGDVKSLHCRVRILNEEGSWMNSDAHQTIPAKSIFVATGAKPNIAYEYEHRGTFLRMDESYQRFELNNQQLVAVESVEHCKSPEFGAFTSYERDHRKVSFLGDTHPVFHGSVVKAIASAQQIYPKIVASLDQLSTELTDKDYNHFKAQMQSLFESVVIGVNRVTSDLVELKVRAPMAAHNFQPGHFYRLQNYEVHANQLADTVLQTEAMALLGAVSATDADVLSFLVLERGVSSRLVATFKPGEPVSVMGPTGVKTKIPESQETVMLVGGTMALAELRTLGPVLRAQGHRVIFVACMAHHNNFYDLDELERAADVILWVTNEDQEIKPRRSTDRVIKGDLILALREYALCDPVVELCEVDRVIVVGSAELIGRVQQARIGLLQEYFNPKAKFFGSVYGAMQCMLKGVCAQCLQWQLDPKTGQRTKAVYSCSWQEQPLELIDSANISARLRQNRMLEILGNCWLDYLFEKYDIIKV